MGRLPDWINLRIPPELRAELERLALAEDRNLANMVNRLLKEAIKVRKQKEA